MNSGHLPQSFFCWLMLARLTIDCFLLLVVLYLAAPADSLRDRFSLKVWSRARARRIASGIKMCTGNNGQPVFALADLLFDSMTILQN